MTIQQMEYIVAVNRYRHFVKASEECGVTQPTLSTMIQKPSRSRITRNSQNRGNGSQRNKNSFWEHQNRNYTHNCTVFSSSVHIYIQKRLSRCRPLHLRNENRQYHLQSQKFIVGYGDRLDSYRPERPFGDTHIL